MIKYILDEQSAKRQFTEGNAVLDAIRPTLSYVQTRNLILEEPRKITSRRGKVVDAWGLRSEKMETLDTKVSNAIQATKVHMSAEKQGSLSKALKFFGQISLDTDVIKPDWTQDSVVLRHLRTLGACTEVTLTEIAHTKITVDYQLLGQEYDTFASECMKQGRRIARQGCYFKAQQIPIASIDKKYKALAALFSKDVSYHEWLTHEYDSWADAEEIGYLFSRT